MNVWCLSFLAPVFLLVTSQLSSHQSQIRHLSLKNFNDLQVGDQLEVYEIVEVTRTL